ncbi:MAG: hypothetical protein JWQ67_2557 [Marmoricola sp.]|nr:hypothetical protein [Marmoricola sp.]
MAPGPRVETYESTTTISAPPGRIWDIWSDVERWSEWTASVTGAELLGGGGPLRVDSRVPIRQPRLRPTGPAHA